MPQHLGFLHFRCLIVLSRNDVLVAELPEWVKSTGDTVFRHGITHFRFQAKREENSKASHSLLWQGLAVILFVVENCQSDNEFYPVMGETYQSFWADSKVCPITL